MINFSNKYIKGLRIKYVFVEMKIPVFFTLEDSKGNDYIGCCCHVEKNNAIFIICVNSADNIFNILMNKVDIYNAFSESNEQFLVSFENNKVKSFEISSKEKLETMYPSKNEKLDLDIEDFEEELKYYKNKAMNENWKTISVPKEISYNIKLSYSIMSKLYRNNKKNEFDSKDYGKKSKGMLLCKN